jgi:hypothetical protein
MDQRCNRTLLLVEILIARTHRKAIGLAHRIRA